MTGGRRAAGEQHDPGGPRPWWRCGGQPAAAACLAIVVFLVVALTTNEYGLTIDEGIYLSGAQRAGEWLALLVTAPSEAASTQAVSEYWPAVLEHGPAAIKDMQPGAVKLAAGLCSLLLGSWLGPLGAARAGTACFAALGCVVAYLFAGRLWGRAVGLYAAGALITVPEVFAHTHLCALDVPVMATTFAAAWLGYEAVRRDSWGWAAACGALWGLALGCKISALFVPVYLLPWAFLVHRRAALKLLIAGAVLGPLTFIASWPWLWHETGARLADYLRFHLQHYPVQVTYLGRVCSYAPWHYPAVMTTFRTPPVTLLLALVGVRLAASRRRRRGEGPNAQHPALSDSRAPTREQPEIAGVARSPYPTLAGTALAAAFIGEAGLDAEFGRWVRTGEVRDGGQAGLPAPDRGVVGGAECEASGPVGEGEGQRGMNPRPTTAGGG